MIVFDSLLRYQQESRLQRQSVSDIPAIAFATDLILTYPSAKIILTNRDPESWYASASRTILRSRLYWLHNVLQYFDWGTGLTHSMRVKIWQCIFDDDIEKNGKDAMKKHYEEVRLCARTHGRDVLEMQLGDGWHQLCAFLKVPIPEEPYPRVNDGDDFLSVMRKKAALRVRAVALRGLQVGCMVATLSFATQFLIRSLSVRSGRMWWWMRYLVRSTRLGQN